MKYLTSERGAVALVTTIIISLLLAIITTSLIATMSSELRQQDDNEQSTLAYYAAQSGVENAIGLIQAAPPGSLNQTACASNLNLDLNRPGQVGWTCQLIFSSGNPTGSINVPDRSVQVDPGDAAYDSVIISWDTTGAAGRPANYFDPPAVAFSSAAYNYAPPLEAAIVQYPNHAFKAGGSQVLLKNAILLPSTSGSGITTFASLAGGNPVKANCLPGAVHHCSVQILGLVSGQPGGNDFLFRLRTRYAGTNYQMTFMNGGSPVSVADGTETIDVTAKSGDAYRRVIYKVPYQSGAAQGLDFVIYSDTNICKDFTFFNGALQNGSSCP